MGVCVVNSQNHPWKKLQLFSTTGSTSTPCFNTWKTLVSAPHLPQSHESTSMDNLNCRQMCLSPVHGGSSDSGHDYRPSLLYVFNIQDNDKKAVQTVDVKYDV